MMKIVGGLPVDHEVADDSGLSIMNVTYACPHCARAARVAFDADTTQLQCPHCGGAVRLPPEGVSDGRLHRCLVCPSAELFVRKDFPQRLGVAVVVAGIVLSSIAWGYQQVTWTFAILLATALVDVVLYFVVGDALMCYRCHAEYRGLTNHAGHGAFDLETHERYRQLGARLDNQRQKAV